MSEFNVILLKIKSGNITTKTYDDLKTLISKLATNNRWAGRLYRQLEPQELNDIVSDIASDAILIVNIDMTSAQFLCNINRLIVKCQNRYLTASAKAARHDDIDDVDIAIDERLDPLTDVELFDQLSKFCASFDEQHNLQAIIFKDFRPGINSQVAAELRRTYTRYCLGQQAQSILRNYLSDLPLPARALLYDYSLSGKQFRTLAKRFKLRLADCRKIIDLHLKKVLTFIINF